MPMSASSAAQRVTPPAQHQHRHPHAQSAPVSPIHSVVGGRIIKRGPSSVQMTRHSSRSSTASEEMISAGAAPMHTHGNGHAYDFNTSHMDMVFPERKMF